MLTALFLAFIKGLLAVLPMFGTCVLGSNDSSSASPTVRDVDASGNEFVYTSTPLVFSSNYSTGGDTLDLTPIAQAAGVTGGIGNLLNAFVEGNGTGSQQSAAGGYYVFLKGTSLSNGKVKIFSAGGAELAAGAYPAAVTGDVVSLVCTWRKFQ